MVDLLGSLAMYINVSICKWLVCHLGKTVKLPHPCVLSMKRKYQWKGCFLDHKNMVLNGWLIMSSWCISQVYFLALCHLLNALSGRWRLHKCPATTIGLCGIVWETRGHEIFTSILEFDQSWVYCWCVQIFCFCAYCLCIVDSLCIHWMDFLFFLHFSTFFFCLCAQICQHESPTIQQPNFFIFWHNTAQANEAGLAWGGEFRYAATLQCPKYTALLHSK